MVTLQQIEEEIKTALKARDRVAADTLRGLKVRIQNEKIAKMRDLSDDELTALVKSEIKRRKEAAEAFVSGNRQDMADKELAESAILEKFLPEQMTEEQLKAIIDQAVTEQGYASQDFGKAMGYLKAKVGQAADGAMLAKLLKEKLK